MAKIYDDANEQHVSCTVIYVNDGKAYNDPSFEDQIQTSDLREAFKKNLVVDVSGVLYETLAYSETEGVGTITYATVDDSSVTAASAVSTVDTVKSKTIIKVKAESPTMNLFGASVGDLQRGVKIDGNVISGTLLNYTASCELTNYWGTGNFIALRFENSTPFVRKIEVGFLAGSGLSELDSDMNGVWKISSERLSNKFTVKTTFEDGRVNIQEFDVSNLNLVP